MGGIKVDADTQVSTIAGLYAAGEAAGGLHGANRLGGNSLSDLLVFGRRAGQYAAEYALGLGAEPRTSADEIEAAGRRMLAPFDGTGGENPYAIHADLEDAMQRLAGIIRVEPELLQALEEIEAFKRRLANISVEGNRQYNPGRHL